MATIKLAEIARKLGKSATDISRDTGINRNTINALMKGSVEDVKFSTLEKICKIYNIQISDILDDVDVLNKHQAKSKQKNVRKLYKQEGEIVPFTCWPWALVAGSFTLKRDEEIIDFGQLDLYFKGDYGIGYWDLNSLKNVASTFYAFYSDKDKYSKLYGKYLYYSAEIEDIYLESHEIVSRELDDVQIRSIFEKLKSAYKGFWDYSLFIDAFDTGVDQERINQIAKEKNLDKKSVEVLTMPVEMTFADERKYAFLSLIEDASISTKDAEKFLGKNKDAIEQYRKKFDYYKSNYTHIKHITLEEMKDEANKYLEDKSVFKEEFKKLEQYEKDKHREIDKVLKKLQLKENPLWFFSNLTYWREHRKKVNLMGIHALDFILSAIEDKTGIQKKYLRYLSFDEVDNVIKGLIPSSTLENRYNEGVLITILGNSYKIYEGAEANSIKKDLENILSGETNKTKVITGQTASQGYAKGIARIILTQEDFSRFKDGEVLVTSMTRPEFVPLMKKSAAIVTNEGGITCHAAIVSRELGKPCIIGTKDATQMIKDGDMVEVRANHGTVRILETK
ncbi:MAG: PEP-utilizing enzyme [Patescibacteria group bacterium]